MYKCCLLLKLPHSILYYLRWGQVFILDSISTYEPTDEREAQSIIERVTPRLAHANASVVLSSVKVCTQVFYGRVN